MQLNETKSFSAWGTNAEVDSSIPVVSTVSLPQLTVGGKKMTLEEVAKVAFFRATVILDLVTLQNVDEKVKVESSSASPVPALEPHNTSNSTVLPVPAARAAIFQLIVLWMQGRSGVRGVAIEFLAALLNADCTPCFRSAQTAPSDLLLATQGTLECRTAGGAVKPAAVAFRESGIASFVFSSTETRSVLQEEFAFTGMAGLVGGYAHLTFRTLDVVAALSCEATGVSLGEAVDSTALEVHRPQRGLMSSAANLKLMLDGSKNTGSAVGSAMERVFRAVPQVHGPALEAAAASAR